VATCCPPAPDSPFAAEKQAEDVVITLTENGSRPAAGGLRVVLDPFVITEGKPSTYGITLMACFCHWPHTSWRDSRGSKPCRA